MIFDYIAFGNHGNNEAFPNLIIIFFTKFLNEKELTALN
jgi:hypothetical protein